MRSLEGQNMSMDSFMLTVKNKNKCKRRMDNETDPDRKELMEEI